ncbi:sulfotransferase [Oceanicaulis sp. LC35]|uniref:sulfotransferase n=1 Tax=Oceanicaulis sp. LC35 TaxID=3349635 RepID=UPI003F82904B
MQESIELMREANSLLAEGHHTQAALLYQQSLSLQPDNAVAVHNLSALRMGADSNDQRISGLYLCQAAATLLGSDQYRADYALALTHLGKGKLALRYLQAHADRFQNKDALQRLQGQITASLGLTRAALNSVLKRKPAPLTFEALNKLHQNGQHELVISSVHKALDLEVRDWRIWHLVSSAHRQSSQAHQALGAARAAQCFSPDAASLHVFSLELMSFGGLHYMANACARQSLKRIGEDPELLATAAFACAQDEKPEDAVTLFEQSSKAAREHVRFRFAYANALSEAGRQSDAAAEALKLARAHPEDEAVLLGALRILNKPGSGALMKEVFDVLDSNGVKITHPAGHFFRALMHQDLGQSDEALKIVEAHFDPKSPPTDEQANFAMVAGKLYDKVQAYDKAYAMYELGNQIHGNLSVSLGRISPSAFPARVRLLYSDLTSKAEDSLSAHTVKSAPDAPQIAFMYSFPRSGTTLLDTIFRTHSDIEVLEEQPTIRDTLLDAHFGDAPHEHGVSWSELLDTFYKTEPERLQELYLNNLARLNKAPLDPGKVYIDKMPLNTPFARLIKYMFPDSRVIFSVRDPADVITSCFFQNFLMNDGMYHFTSVERAVAIYDQVMNFWVKAEEILDLDVSYVRYEELITDLQGVVQPIVESLGLPWEDSLVDFWKTAREREVIRTASADQVIQKLYTTSKGRWTRYSALNNGALAPLEPWRKHFGYA